MVAEVIKEATLGAVVVAAEALEVTGGVMVRAGDLRRTQARPSLPIVLLVEVAAVGLLHVSAMMKVHVLPVYRSLLLVAAEVAAAASTGIVAALEAIQAQLPPQVILGMDHLLVVIAPPVEAVPMAMMDREAAAG